MIKINLALRKQASFVGGAVRGSSSSAASFKLNFGNVPSGMKSILWPLAVGIAAHFGFEHYIETQNTGMQVEIVRYEGEKKKIETELNQIKGYENVKNDLEKTEKTLSNKIDIIQNLLKGRELAYKALVGLSQSMSNDVWLSEFEENQQGWRIKGYSMDVSTVSDFMSKLGQSIYYKEVSLKTTSSDPTSGKTTFELTARRE